MYLLCLSEGTLSKLSQWNFICIHLRWLQRAMVRQVVPHQGTTSLLSQVVLQLLLFTDTLQSAARVCEIHCQNNILRAGNRTQDMAACTSELVVCIAADNREATVSWKPMIFFLLFSMCTFGFVPSFEHKISRAGRNKRKGEVFCC